MSDRACQLLCFPKRKKKRFSLSIFAAGSQITEAPGWTPPDFRQDSSSPVLCFL